MSNKIKIGVTLTKPKEKFDFFRNWLTEENDTIEVIELSVALNNANEIGNCNGIVLSGGVDIHPQFYNNTNTTYLNPPKEGFQENRDKFEMEVFNNALKKNIPILGVCRGFQLINCILGGDLIQDLGELNNIHRAEKYIDKKHNISISEDTLLYDIIGSSRIYVNSAHHQAIGKLSEQLIINAKSDEGIIEGFEWADKKEKAFLLGVQWHPERMNSIEFKELSGSKNVRDTFLTSVINQSTSRLINYTLHLADNTLILAQRNAEWCGHGPILEQDIAITNISLDLIGQSRNFYQYAATLIGNGATEDSLAYLRKEREFKNCLLVEQPKGDWAQTILRQFFFGAYQFLLYEKLQHSDNEQLAAIAEKALKEVTYHVNWSSEWVIRLGDGTEESKNRLIKAVDELYLYTGELFMPADYEEAGVDVSELKEAWMKKITDVFEEATIAVPEKVFAQTGGKNGVHTEHLGYILTDLQYMQRAYPNMEW